MWTREQEHTKNTRVCLIDDSLSCQQKLEKTFRYSEHPLLEEQIKVTDFTAFLISSLAFPFLKHFGRLLGCLEGVQSAGLRDPRKE